MIVIASLLSKDGVSPTRKKWTMITMASMFYPLVLWEMRDLWRNPIFFVFPLGMIMTLVYLFTVDWRKD